MIKKVFSLILPIVLLLAATICSELIVKQFGKTWKTYTLLPLFGISIGLLCVYVLNKLSASLKIQKMVLGNFKGFLFGITLGIAVSILSATLFYITKGPALNFNLLLPDFHLKLLGNIFPATVEEITFRGGIVHFLTAFWGKFAGLLGGSIPFGVIHLFGKLFGHPVDLMHVIGVSVAGLSLSYLYLELGLLPAISYHLIWNSLCSKWVSVFELPRKGGVQQLEGFWGTSLVIVIVFSVLIYFRNRKCSKNIPLLNASREFNE